MTQLSRSPLFCIHVLYLCLVCIHPSKYFVTIRLFVWLCISFFIAISLKEWKLYKLMASLRRNTRNMQWMNYKILLIWLMEKRIKKNKHNRTTDGTLKPHDLNKRYTEIPKSPACNGDWFRDRKLNSASCSNEVPRNSTMVVLDRLINSQTDDLVW